MRANASGTTQLQRRTILEAIRGELGDQLFADFMVDCLSQNGSSFAVPNLPALASVWLGARQSMLAALGGSLDRGKPSPGHPARNSVPPHSAPSTERVRGHP